MINMESKMPGRESPHQNQENIHIQHMEEDLGEARADALLLAASKEHLNVFVPRCCRFPNAPSEASGLAVDVFARATVAMSSLFLGPALLELASADAKEECNGCDDARIYGFRPTSLLANIAVVSGLLGSITLPLFGAIVDYTPYRRQVGAYTAAGLVLVKATEFMIGPNTWMIVAMLQVVSSFLYNFHITATFAYTSELSNESKAQSSYNSYYSMLLFCSTLNFLLIVLTLSALLSTNDVGTAKISQALTTIVSAPLFYFGWTRLFHSRPALRHLPDSGNILTCGFSQVLDTFQTIRRKYKSLQWLIFSIACVEAAASALISISTTYMKQVLDMDANEIGFVFLVFLIAGIPGSKLAEILALRWDPVVSAMVCDGFHVIATSCAVVIIKGPEDKSWMYLFGLLWGLGSGWYSPMHTAAFISIIPKGQEAELMGTYLLSSQILVWLPPALFTLLNETGVSMAWGVASLNLYFILGIYGLSQIQFEEAVALVRSTEQDHVEMLSNAFLEREIA